MMYGSVNQICEAILPVVVKNNVKTKLVDAVIDTGFSGFLTLPSHVIAALDLTWKGRDEAALGDGTACILMSILLTSSGMVSIARLTSMNRKLSLGLGCGCYAAMICEFRQ